MSLKGMRRDLRKSGYRAQLLVEDVEEEILEWLHTSGTIIAPNTQNTHGDNDQQGRKRTTWTEASERTPRRKLSRDGKKLSRGLGPKSPILLRSQSHRVFELNLHALPLRDGPCYRSLNALYTPLTYVLLVVLLRGHSLQARAPGESMARCPHGAQALQSSNSPDRYRAICW